MDETKIQILMNECCLHLLNIGKNFHLGVAQIIMSIYEYIDIGTNAIPKKTNIHGTIVLVELVAKLVLWYISRK